MEAKKKRRLCIAMREDAPRFPSSNVTGAGKSRARTCSAVTHGWTITTTTKKEKFLPVMSRESRFGPGSDHGGGGKSGRRTAPQPRLAPAWREKQPRTEGTAHRLRPAETVHGKGREPGRVGGAERGVFSGGNS